MFVISIPSHRLLRFRLRLLSLPEELVLSSVTEELSDTELPLSADSLEEYSSLDVAVDPLSSLSLSLSESFSLSLVEDALSDDLSTRVFFCC